MVGSFYALCSIVCLNSHIAFMTELFREIYRNAKATSSRLQATTVLYFEKILSKERLIKTHKHIEEFCAPLVRLILFVLRVTYIVRLWSYGYMVIHPFIHSFIHSHIHVYISTVLHFYISTYLHINIMHIHIQVVYMRTIVSPIAVFVILDEFPTIICHPLVSS